MTGMVAGRRTRTSLAAAALVVLSAGVLLPGCAPHRRGRLPASTAPRPAPDRERIVQPPAEDVREPLPDRPVFDHDDSDSGRVCELALSFLGTPYRYGGATPAGFDCSGLVLYVFKEVGVALPRTARDQSRSGSATTLRTMLPGDLIFFRIDRDVISHVGIYVGRGEFVHAPGTGKFIRTDSIDNPWWRRRVKGVRRILETPPLAG